MNINKYDIDQVYSASYITDGAARGIYDGLIILVDGTMDHISDWVYEEQEAANSTYEEAVQEVISMLPIAYEDAKHFVVFEGMVPNMGQGFDLFTNYKCIYKV